MFGLTDKKRPNFSNAKKLGWLHLCLLFALSACGEGGGDTDRSASQASSIEVEASQDYPEPPPPITSATQILSGGWLLRGDGSDPQFDSILVIRDGKVVGLGKRGSVDVPADSVGIDASGKWILPGTADQLLAAFQERKHDAPTQFATAQMAAIEVGSTANLVLLKSNPLTDPQALEDVHAVVLDGVVQVLAKEES